MRFPNLLAENNPRRVDMPLNQSINQSTNQKEENTFEQ